MADILDLQVGISADDCGRYNGSFSLTAGTPYWRHPTVQVGWGARWLNVTIVPGSTVDIAYMTWTSSGNWGAVGVRTIYGDAEANASTFSTLDDFDARPRTTKTAAYSVPAVTLDEEYNTASLVELTQEIIDIVGWASGNALAILQNKEAVGGASAGYAFDQSTIKAPKIHIEYTAGGGTAVPVFEHHYRMMRQG